VHNGEHAALYGSEQEKNVAHHSGVEPSRRSIGVRNSMSANYWRWVNTGHPSNPGNATFEDLPTRHGYRTQQGTTIPGDIP